MSSGRDNYFSFFPFLPIAFSKIPFSVAPDFVAPSPNLAIKDFSSSICAAFTLNFTLLVFKSSSVIFASRAFPGENTSGLASAASLAKSTFLIVTISLFLYQLKLLHLFLKLHEFSW